ncbi:MAG: sigma-54-dependent Fis family transcriptional regulator [Candidatus Marinimicrobia bacterium]|nr:sigma-54-dependent Fis family transcriptional regulator [Candidatus Neomarinimicrobiota bacterium]MBT6412943.1 sigma-54-dependent Fis family transcriptional regulator [Candidatus Neomarinimicrobiota bacterium]MBT6797084.1 sigma-54-dependent Fis family transcriptional regulator [Candidatus Neomarinimicrobiota bacterium]
MAKILHVGGTKKSFPELTPFGHSVDTVQNGLIALSALSLHNYDVVVIEDELPLLSPAKLIYEINSLSGRFPIIALIRKDERRNEILTDFGNDLFGWFEPKIGTPEQLSSLIDTAYDYHQFLDELPTKLGKKLTFQGCYNIIGISKAMQENFKLLLQIQEKDVTTLLRGESGTGKNLVAKLLHTNGTRSLKPFISVNCPAIPSELLESELFGHEKGAFTGAIERKDGKFLVADGGTIFLDEIGDMSPSLQAKILRVLESGEIERVGGAETKIVDVRIISATNQDLDAMIRDGKFRQDLFHRLNVFPISLPPLRTRIGDIPLLSMMILKKLRKKHNMPVNYIGPEAMELLKEYNWPGNVRELENTLERCILISDNKHLKRDDIESVLVAEFAHAQVQKSLLPEDIALTVNKEATLETASNESSNMIIENPSVTNEVKTLKQLEYEAIVLGLERTKWNLTLISKQLGISRMTLYRKLKQHGLGNKN